MEGIGASTIGNVGGMLSFFMLSKIIRYMQSRKAKGILLLKGKSNLCDKYTSNDIIFLDIDNLLEKLPEYEEAKDKPSALFLLYPLIKQRVNVLTNGFNKQVVYVSRNWDLLRTMVRRKNIFYLCGSQEFHKKSQLLYNDPQQFALDDILRLKYLHRINKKQIKVCESLGDIDKHVKEIFGVTNVAM